MSEHIKCPFCSEDGFDLIGLKNHFSACEMYQQTPSLIDLIKSARDTLDNAATTSPSTMLWDGEKIIGGGKDE